MVRLTDRPDMTSEVYRGRKTTTQHNNKETRLSVSFLDGVVSASKMGPLHIN